MAEYTPLQRRERPGGAVLACGGIVMSPISGGTELVRLSPADASLLAFAAENPDIAPEEREALLTGANAEVRAIADAILAIAKQGNLNSSPQLRPHEGIARAFLAAAAENLKPTGSR
jgi:hypothetical protein